jgi:hypothetical protein
MTLKKTLFESILNKSIEQIENASIRIPFDLTSDITKDKIILFRVCFFY